MAYEVPCSANLVGHLVREVTLTTYIVAVPRTILTRSVRRFRTTVISSLWAEVSSQTRRRWQWRPFGWHLSWSRFEVPQYYIFRGSACPVVGWHVVALSTQTDAVFVEYTPTDKFKELGVDFQQTRKVVALRWKGPPPWWVTANRTFFGRTRGIVSFESGQWPFLTFALIWVYLFSFIRSVSCSAFFLSYSPIISCPIIYTLLSVGGVGSG